MPTLKREEVKQLSEPIIIEAGILNDKEYRLEKITLELINEVKKLIPVDIKKEDLPDDIVYKQLGILLNVSPDEFKGADLRVVKKVIDFIQDSIFKDETKNPSGAGAK